MVWLPHRVSGLLVAQDSETGPRGNYSVSTVYWTATRRGIDTLCLMLSIKSMQLKIDLGVPLLSNLHENSHDNTLRFLFFLQVTIRYCISSDGRVRLRITLNRGCNWSIAKGLVDITQLGLAAKLLVSFILWESVVYPNFCFC